MTAVTLKEEVIPKVTKWLGIFLTQNTIVCDVNSFMYQIMILKCDLKINNVESSKILTFQKFCGNILSSTFIFEPTYRYRYMQMQEKSVAKSQNHGFEKFPI